MITVTKMNGTRIVLNAELIETITAHPDTHISLTSGNRLMVKEKIEEIVEKVKEYRKNINAEAWKELSNLKEEE